MPPKRMTANPLKPLRYRPGKPTGPEDHSSSDDDSDAPDDDEDNNAQSQRQQQSQSAQKLPQRAPPPKTSSFANVDLDARRREAEAAERARRKEEAQAREKMEREAGFVTESEEEDDSESAEDDDDDHAEPRRATIAKRPTQSIQHPSKQPQLASDSGSDSGSEEDSDDESDSSSEDEKPKLLRPTFIRKDQRKATAAVDPYAEAEAQAARDRQRKQEAADALVQERIEAQAAARAAGRKGWDDDAGEEDEIPDDTDGLDQELEYTQWVARELMRLKRARAALEEREAEIAEVERRRELTSAEREKEDREFIEAQQEKKKERGGMASVLQKYHHKGAFFADDSRELGLLDRDVMGARFEDQAMGGGGGTAGVPEYLQVRDATMIGRKGRTRYKDMKTEDTGRWGEGFETRRGGGGSGKRDDRGGYADVQDERFRPDFGRSRDGPGATGANASAVGQKRSGHGQDGHRDGKRPKVSDER